MALSKSAMYYRTNEKARQKRLEYQREYNKRKEERERRAKLVKENRARGTYGNGDKKDVSHTKRGTVLKPQSVNRGSKTDTAGDRRARGGKKKK
jgi:hypothetical protein